MSYKNKIRRILNEQYDFRVRISSKEIDRSVMQKQLFIGVLDQLKKIEDRKDFLAEEIGMDMTHYEDQFFAVIDNLFKLAFNKSQLALIQMYIYKLVPDKEWDGMITIEENKQEKDVPFKSPDDVWDVIKKFEK